MEDMKLSPEKIGILTTLLSKELRGYDENRCFSSDLDRKIKELMKDLNNLRDELRKHSYAYQWIPITGRICMHVLLDSIDKKEQG